MSISADIQQLEPGRLIELFEIDCTTIGGDMMRAHGHRQSGSIFWQGNEYKPWPIQASGFKRTTDSQQPTPTLTVGDINGTISALCVYLADLVGATVRRRRTLVKYLDAANFVTDVAATNQQFGLGDGVTKAFQLVGSAGQPVNQNAVVQSIYRNDWQGNQLLYATPRTNQFLQSSNLTSASWAKGNVASIVGATGPDGSSNAITLTSTSGGIGRLQQSIAVTAGVPIPISVLAQAGSSPSCRMVSSPQAGQATFNLTGAGSVSGVSGTLSNAAIVPLGDGWYDCSATLTPTTTGANVIVPIEVVAASESATFFGPQLGAAGDPLGSYIPTTTAAVTVTDYVAASSGLVTLASAPARGAQLKWSGAGQSASNPTADPTAEMAAEIWRVEQKSDEQPGLQVEFTLASPLDFGGQQLPARQIVSICQWKYRDAICGYTGTAYFDANDQPVSDPALDRCSMKISGCECRFGVNNPLSIGGFLSDTLS